MHRRMLVACLAAFGALLHVIVNAAAPPQLAKPNQSELYVILKARVYEVDEAFHQKVAKAKWLSRADLEKLEEKAPQESPLFALLEKKKPTLTGKGINVDPGKEGLLLTSMKTIKCLPTPEQLQTGKKAPQTFDEGFTLRAQVHLSPDRRFVRAKFMEKSLEIEGVEQVKVLVDLDKEIEEVGEVVSTKEGSTSWMRYVPDGGSILLPLRHRSAALRKKERWLVVEVTPRIYVEEEERERRKQNPPD